MIDRPRIYVLSKTRLLNSIMHEYSLHVNSRTPDQDFRCFHPCAIIISHLHVPIPALGEIKNEQPHVGRTLAARLSVTSL